MNRNSSTPSISKSVLTGRDPSTRQMDNTQRFFLNLVSLLDAFKLKPGLPLSQDLDCGNAKLQTAARPPGSMARIASVAR